MNLPECLVDFIGVKTCQEDHYSPSGLFINDLEGITVDRMTNIFPLEKRSGLKFIKEKINFSAELVLNDLHKFISPYLNLKKISALSNNFYYTHNFLTPVNINRGLYIKKTTKNAYTKIKIKSVKILTDSAENINIYVTDGIKTTSINSVTTPREVSEFFPNFVSLTDHVYVYVNNEFISVNDSYIKVTNSSCGCYKNYNNSLNDELIISGWDGYNTTPNTFGITADVVLECDYNSIFCAIADSAKYLFLYRAGIEVVKEWITSERVNNDTINNLEQAAFLLKKFEDEYDKQYKTYAYTVKSSLKNINDPCIECRGLNYSYNL